jgi:hypothetical protein
MSYTPTLNGGPPRSAGPPGRRCTREATSVRPSTSCHTHSRRTRAADAILDHHIQPSASPAAQPKPHQSSHAPTCRPDPCASRIAHLPQQSPGKPSTPRACAHQTHLRPRWSRPGGVEGSTTSLQRSPPPQLGREGTRCAACSPPHGAWHHGWR